NAPHRRLVPSGFERVPRRKRHGRVEPPRHFLREPGAEHANFLNAAQLRERAIRLPDDLFAPSHPEHALALLYRVPRHRGRDYRFAAPGGRANNRTMPLPDPLVGFLDRLALVVAQLEHQRFSSTAVHQSCKASMSAQFTSPVATNSSGGGSSARSAPIV